MPSAAHLQLYTAGQVFDKQDKSEHNESFQGQDLCGDPWERKIWDAAITMPSTGASDSDEWEHIRSRGLLPESGQVSY